MSSTGKIGFGQFGNSFFLRISGEIILEKTFLEGIF